MLLAAGELAGEVEVGRGRLSCPPAECAAASSVLLLSCHSDFLEMQIRMGVFHFKLDIFGSEWSLVVVVLAIAATTTVSLSKDERPWLELNFVFSSE